jgi:hypothetical protein
MTASWVDRRRLVILEHLHSVSQQHDESVNANE